MDKEHQLLMLFLVSCAAVALAQLVIEPILGVLWLLLVVLVLVVLALCKPALWQKEKAWIAGLRGRVAGSFEGPQEEPEQQQRYELVAVRVEEGRHFEIHSKIFLIGRGAKCDCRLTRCGMVGREHCRIIYREHSKEYYIEDLRSMNGTYLGTRRLEPNTQVKLLENAEIVIGDYCLRFQKKMRN